MSSSPQAAPPLLGSSLLAAARAHENARPAPASSGSAAIDRDALDGGFRYGEITAIAGASGTGKSLVGLRAVVRWMDGFVDTGNRLRLRCFASVILIARPIGFRVQALTYCTYQLAYHAMASHLLTYNLGEVAFIDTTGSFSPLRLRNVLAYRLEAKIQRNNYQESGYMYEKRTSALENSKKAIVDQATSMLDRVKVMRVFDLAGGVEAISEVNERMEETTQEFEKPPLVAVGKSSDEIGDSEEEPDEEDEGLRGSGPHSHPHSHPHSGPTGMIIFDTITNVVSAMMAKSQVQGQALLASFMRSLHHLTSRHHICTILTNAAVGRNSSNNPDYQHGPREDVSIFSSTMGKPALGKTFTFLIDTSVFLSTVPRTSDDATLAFGDGGQASCYLKALILEILKDRCGAREGRWAAFEIAAEVKIVPSG